MSWSNFDIFSKFTLLLLCGSFANSLKGFDDTVLYKINWDELEDNGQKYEKLLIHTNQKEQYECFIPQAVEKESKNEVDYNGLTPFQLVQPLFSSSICSYRVENYWNYQLCFGNYIRQFHEERDGKNVKVQEYFLGKWNQEQNTEAYQAKIKQNNEKLNYKKIDGVNLPYFELEMANGTICDINNQERRTKVLFICYPNGKNEIYNLKETATCNYEIIVLTNLLCAHPKYKPHENEEMNINCSAVNKSPKKPRALLSMEVENMKSYFQKISDFKNVLKAGIFKDNAYRMDLIQSQMKPKILEEKAPADSHNMQSYKNKLTKPTDTSPVDAFLDGKKCLTGGKGWWKYEFCYQKHVRQFHVDEKGVETSILLGTFNAVSHVEWIKKNPHKVPKNGKLTQINQLYTDGSFCQETGKHRQTEVQMKCDESSTSPAKISLYLLEPQVCNYILGVESPIICDLLKRFNVANESPESATDDSDNIHKRKILV